MRVGPFGSTPLCARLHNHGAALCAHLHSHGVAGPGRVSIDHCSVCSRISNQPGTRVQSDLAYPRVHRHPEEKCLPITAPYIHTVCVFDYPVPSSIRIFLWIMMCAVMRGGLTLPGTWSESGPVQVLLLYASGILIPKYCTLVWNRAGLSLNSSPTLMCFFFFFMAWHCMCVPGVCVVHVSCFCTAKVNTLSVVFCV